jgi:hypothetical protein
MTEYRGRLAGFVDIPDVDPAPYVVLLGGRYGSAFIFAFEQSVSRIEIPQSDAPFPNRSQRKDNPCTIIEVEADTVWRGLCR